MPAGSRRSRRAAQSELPQRARGGKPTHLPRPPPKTLLDNLDDSVHITIMHDDMITTLTARGQTSVPARCRREANLKPGQKLRWEQVSATVFRVAVETTDDAPGPLAALGWARRFHSTPPPRTDDVLCELRDGDAE